MRLQTNPGAASQSAIQHPVARKLVFLGAAIKLNTCSACARACACFCRNPLFPTLTAYAHVRLLTHGFPPGYLRSYVRTCAEGVCTHSHRCPLGGAAFLWRMYPHEREALACAAAEC